MEHERRTVNSDASGQEPVAASNRSTVRAVVGLDFVLFGLIFPILPLYSRHFGMSVVNIGIMLGAYSIAQVITAPIWGRIADRSGRRVVLLIALLGSALSAIGLAAADSAIVLIVAVVLNGASGGSMAIAQAAIADITPGRQHAREFGLLGAYVAVGFVIGPGLAAMSGLGGIRLPFIVAAALGTVNLAIAVWRFPETLGVANRPGPGAAVEHDSAKSTLRVRWLCLTALGLAVFGFGAFEATFALLGRRSHGFGVVGTSLSFVLLGLVVAAIEGRALGPVLRRLGPVSTIGAGGVSFAVGLVLVGISGTVVVLGVGLVFLGLGYGLISPVLSAAAVAVAPAPRRARALGWQQSVSGLARTLGPVVGASLFAGEGPRTSYLVFGLVVLVIVAALFAGDFRGALDLVRSSPRFSDPAPREP